MAWNSVSLEQWWKECGNLEINCNFICNCEQEHGYSSLQDWVWERDIEKKKLEWRTYLRRLVLLHLCHCTEWRSGEGITRRVIWRRRPRQRSRRHHPDHHPPIKMYITRGRWVFLELLLPARKWARFGQCSHPPSCEVPFAGDGVVVATGADILFMWKMDMRMSNESLSNSNGSWSSSVVNSALMGCCLNATITTISWPGICIYINISLISHFFFGVSQPVHNNLKWVLSRLSRIVGRKKISSSQFSCSNPNWSSPSIKGMWRSPTRNPEKQQLSHHLFCLTLHQKSCCNNRFCCNKSFADSST